SQSHAIDTMVWINPGVKISYTFGEGLTWGFEISVVLMPESWDDMKERPWAYGFVFSIDSNFDGLTKYHLGGELVGPFIGIESGPSYIKYNGKGIFGLSTSFWGGLWILPFYTYTNVFGSSQSFHELGSHFKLHLTPNGNYSGDGDDDDHDIF
nr:hypothetical protein [Deltaproteobacteria bacterium]